MSESNIRQLPAAQRAARDAVRSLRPPRPDEAFSARLRQEFVSGRIGRRRGQDPQWAGFAASLRGLRWLPVAAALAAVVGSFANRGPDWHVNPVHGEGTLRVNGALVAQPDDRTLARLLRRGGRVQVEGGMTLDLVAPGMLAVAIAPGADVVLPQAPNRWFGRGLLVNVHAGDVYFATGRRFHGATLDVATPQARVRAVGTAFAVLCADFGTCVCVMEGVVRVGGVRARPGDGVEVPKGMRRVVHPDQVAETLPILEDSVHHLHRQLASVGDELGRD